MRKCHSCGNPIGNNATKCPKCGEPHNTQAQNSLVFFAVVAFIIWVIYHSFKG